jgi:hypothetical protein
MYYIFNKPNFRYSLIPISYMGLYYLGYYSSKVSRKNNFYDIL